MRYKAKIHPVFKGADPSPFSKGKRVYVLIENAFSAVIVNHQKTRPYSVEKSRLYDKSQATPKEHVFHGLLKLKLDLIKNGILS